MKKLIFKIAARIARWARPGVRVVAIDPKLLAAARAVIEIVDKDIENASAENKHARAFALLGRAWPRGSRRDIGLAIELALR